MKDPSEEILNAVFTLIDGQFSYNSEIWCTYIDLPRNHDRRYVWIQDVYVNQLPEIVQDEYIYDCTLNIEVGSISNYQDGNNTAVNSIVNQLTQKIVTTGLTLTSFYVILGPDVSAINPISREVGEDSIENRRQIIFNIRCQQK